MNKFTSSCLNTCIIALLGMMLGLSIGRFWVSHAAFHDDQVYWVKPVHK